MTRAAAGKNIWLVGGGDLVGQFADAGLLDEILVGLAPSRSAVERLSSPPADGEARTVDVARDRRFARLRYRVRR